MLAGPPPEAPYGGVGEEILWHIIPVKDIMVRFNDKKVTTAGIYALLLCMSVILLSPVVIAREGSFFIIADNLRKLLVVTPTTETK